MKKGRRKIRVIIEIEINHKDRDGQTVTQAEIRRNIKTVVNDNLVWDTDTDMAKVRHISSIEV